ncbi:MAG: insulinase family protein [Bacteroidetes bacterium]|nr:MAG: insulinase family protein [Bacteroidota bacterium]TAG85454.1 MAG: insulinase family protein [Bacteroidota bacterium]
MINFNQFTLENGLKIFVHEDSTTPMSVFNLMYDVGAKDENPEKTGFAHLFEHLMFGGSVNIPHYDIAAQNAGATNNAFTSNDLTNYYLTLPAFNIETAFWLESDRMLSLDFSPDSLEVQRKVVIEEFKQRYLNQPYGDVWLHLRPLAYTTHPYRWATIGKEISHIENATLEDVKDFFFQFYRPNNAVLVVAGNVTTEQVKNLTQKWFGDIPSGKPYHRNLPKEPAQTTQRRLKVEANVPLNALYMVFHSESKYEKSFVATDLLSDILGRGKSSRLYQILVKEKQLFNSISASVLGTIEEGLFVIQGKLNPNISYEEGEKAIWEVINEVKNNTITENELQKVKNQAETSEVMAEIELLNRAIMIASYALNGKENEINQRIEWLQNVATEDILKSANKILTEQNSCVLYYGKK